MKFGVVKFSKFTLAGVAWFSGVASAQHFDSATFKACETGYADAISLTSLLGQEADTRLAPRIDIFLGIYSLNYLHATSCQKYLTHHQSNAFPGDARGMYLRCQRSNRECDTRSFEKILAKLTAFEAFVGPFPGETRPKDRLGHAYIRCLRAYMIEALRKLPEHSHYALKPGEFLKRLEFQSTLPTHTIRATIH